MQRDGEGRGRVEQGWIGAGARPGQGGERQREWLLRGKMWAKPNSEGPSSFVTEAGDVGAGPSQE